MEDNSDFVINHNLSRLKRILNYEVSSSVLFFLSFIAPIFFFITLLAAIVFTPFMMHVLLREKKTGWIVLFILIVIIPVITFIILAAQFEMAIALLLVPMALYYFYCFLLRFTVNGWVRELNFRHQYMLDKKRSEEELEAFMKQLE